MTDAVNEPIVTGEAGAEEPPSKRRFGGIARLYGVDQAERIAAAQVAVVGIGGVGSWAAEALARSGVRRLTLIDLDHIAESNINRQIHALDGQIGRAKVEAMAERISLINPACTVRVVDDFLTADNCAALLGDCTAVIDAIDAVRAKAALVAYCRAQSKTVVVCGGAGGKRDATKIRHADLADVRDDALLTKLRAELRKHHGFPLGNAAPARRRFGIDAVFVDEPVGGAAPAASPGAALNCAGYGSAMHITASLGLAAVGVLFERLTA